MRRLRAGAGWFAIIGLGALSVPEIGAAQDASYRVVGGTVGYDADLAQSCTYEETPEVGPCRTHDDVERVDEFDYQATARARFGVLPDAYPAEMYFGQRPLVLAPQLRIDEWEIDEETSVAGGNIFCGDGGKWTYHNTVGDITHDGGIDPSPYLGYFVISRGSSPTAIAVGTQRSPGAYFPALDFQSGSQLSTVLESEQYDGPMSGPCEPFYWRGNNVTERHQVGPWPVSTVGSDDVAPTSYVDLGCTGAICIKRASGTTTIQQTSGPIVISWTLDIAIDLTGSTEEVELPPPDGQAGMVCGKAKFDLHRLRLDQDEDFVEKGEQACAIVLSNPLTLELSKGAAIAAPIVLQRFGDFLLAEFGDDAASAAIDQHQERGINRLIKAVMPRLGSMIGKFNQIMIAGRVAGLTLAAYAASKYVKHVRKFRACTEMLLGRDGQSPGLIGGVLFSPYGLKNPRKDGYLTENRYLQKHPKRFRGDDWSSHPTGLSCTKSGLVKVSTRANEVFAKARFVQFR